MRRAPKTGYDFANKRQYRRDIWATFERGYREATHERSLADAHFLILPSSEGAEIEQALRRGVRQAHLHCVDDNPAIVATLKRRYPEIETYGVSVERAAERIAAKGVRLAGANLDLTGSLSFPYLERLARVIECGAWTDQAHVAVTALRGREAAGFCGLLRDVGGLLGSRCADAGEAAKPRAQMVREGFRQVRGGMPNDADLGRMIVMQQALSRGAYVARPRWQMMYRSGLQTMLVVMFVIRPRAVVEEYRRRPSGDEWFGRYWVSWWDKWISWGNCTHGVGCTCPPVSDESVAAFFTRCLDEARA